MNARLQVLLVRAGRAKRWPSDLGRPTDPLEQTLRARAHSLLHGVVADRQGRPLTASDFTRDQARDVIAWAEPAAAAPYGALRRLLRFFSRD